MNIKQVAGVIAFACITLASEVALASDPFTGVVKQYEFNSEVAGRGPCIQMLPQIPGGACLWKNNPLYNEINTLLLNAYLQQKTCTVWSTSPDRTLITIIRCN